MNKCEYGCGNDSNFVMKNGKYCCSKHYSSCPKIKEKNSNGVSTSLKEQYKNGNRTSHFGEYNKNNYRHTIGVWKHTDETKKKLSETSTGISGTDSGEIQRRKKISDKIKKRYEDGWLPKAGRCKKIKYISRIAGEVLLDGSWELKVAQYLDKNEIKWDRNTRRFKYISDNKERHYTPDFYLIDENIFLEVKGYKTELDELKWNQFPDKLEVWDKKILKIKGIL